jgi:Type II CAAX prenyl endopeptidase Rce1-like
MTTIGLSRPGPRSVAVAGPLAVALGMGILLLRPTIGSRVGWTVLIVTAVFVAVLVLGVATPVDRTVIGHRASTRIVLVSLVAGVGIFAIGWLAGGGHPPYPLTAEIVSLNTLAAVAEEALFRRVAFAALLPAGPGVAIVGSAVLFGLAHATVYGWWAVPLDTAAGLVLGWQRWVGGSWVLPAFTHAVADLLVVI